jgi:hypothetical protein
MLDRQCGEVCVSGEIAGRPGPFEQAEQDPGVPSAWVDDSYIRLGQPPRTSHAVVTGSEFVRICRCVTIRMKPSMTAHASATG